METQSVCQRGGKGRSVRRSVYGRREGQGVCATVEGRGGVGKGVCIYGRREGEGIVCDSGGKGMSGGRIVCEGEGVCLTKESKGRGGACSHGIV